MAIGALLAAIPAAAQIALQAGAQQDQRNISYLNLYEQKRQAREREALAKATRSDAYGNKVRYVPGEGFVTDVTALTGAILNAQQKEQLAQFRDDAPRIRAAAERMDARAREADEVYDEKFNQYRYGRRKSEEEYIAEAIRNALDARRGNTDNNANEMLSRAAMRLGNSGAAKNLLKAARESTPEQSLSEAIAEAKKLGKQQFFAETNAANASTFGELNSLRAIADAVMQGNMNWSNENNALSGRQDDALSDLIQTNAANSSAVGSAMKTAADAAGLFPNFSGLSSALSGIKFEKGEPQPTEQEKLLADLLLQEKIGTARVGIHRNNAALSAFRGNSGVI